jgi:thymidylate synthase (FAD)
MEVTLIDNLGSDLTVVNAARVSFDKESEWDLITDPECKFPDTEELIDPESRTFYFYDKKKVLKAGDEKLIQFLAKHNHWSPFAHPQIQLRIKAPIFVARQLAKHQVGLVWNEISRRYVDNPPEFFFPDKWRKKSPDKKQGSYEDEFVEFAEELQVESLVKTIAQTYEAMINMGVCAEQARMILPQNMYTEWYWTGSLFAFARVCGLRLKKDTQYETRLIAEQISNIIEPLFPVSWKALTTK